jgi:hypothetical protein
MRNTILLACLAFGLQATAQSDTVYIPLGGNAWTQSGRVTKTGLAAGWKDATVYFHVSHTGRVQLVLPGGVTASLNGQKDWTITDTGYQKVTLTSPNGPALKTLALIAPGPVAFTPTNEGNFFYWGRRGPSVHLSYATPKDASIQWFYNEVTVPEGQDVQGSYFMADGFGQGYFGMQVNSPTERHILFSVWSPFQTDDPKAIPDSLRINLLRKGDGVHAGSFGNEGSGGQSYLNYMWKAGNTYHFLLKAQPGDSNRTDFTAWFYAPEEGHWRLIASFSRPQTHSWLTGLHSFLENFDPEAGDKTRYVLFNNQWIADAPGHWTPVYRARFTGDNTARKGYRLDYAGGVLDGAFFLKNAGFFSARVPLDTWFERPAAATPPDVDLTKLP